MDSEKYYEFGQTFEKLLNDVMMGLIVLLFILSLLKV